MRTLEPAPTGGRIHRGSALSAEPTPLGWTRLSIGVAVLVAAFAWTAPPAGATTSRNCSNPKGCVLVLNVSGLIDPIEVDYLERSMAEASASPGYVQTVVVIDSGGAVVSDARLDGLVDHMRNQRVPVSVWVGPSGAEARGGAAELVAAVSQFGVATMASGPTIGDGGAQRLALQQNGWNEE